jgi:hypothetical protein
MSSAIPFAVLGGLYAVAAFLSLHSGGAREVVAAFIAAVANPGGGSLVVRGAAIPRVAREEARRVGLSRGRRHSKLRSRSPDVRLVLFRLVPPPRPYRRTC